MYAWFYKESTVLLLPVVSMLVFMAVFLGAVVRATVGYRHRREDVQHLSGLPLQPERLAPAAGNTGGRQ